MKIRRPAAPVVRTATGADAATTAQTGRRAPLPKKSGQTPATTDNRVGRSSGGSPGPPNRTDRPRAAKSNNGAAGDGDAGPTARTRTTTTLIRTAATGRTGFQRIPGTITAIETAPLRTAATTPGTARAQTVATTTVTTATEETPRRNKTRTPATEPWPGAHPLSETQLTSAEPDRQPTVTRPAFAGRRWPVRRAAPS